MARRLSSPPVVTMQKLAARDFVRFMRSENGEKPEEIALAEGVSPKTIERSLESVRQHRALNTQENLNHAVVGMMVDNLQQVGKTFGRALKAKRYVEEKKPDGSVRLVKIPDIDRQMQALEVYQKYLGSMQPKGGSLLNLKIQQNNANQAAAVTNVRGGGGYEEVLHEILNKANAHSALPSKTADVIDADDDSDDDSDEDDDEVLVAK